MFESKTYDTILKEMLARTDSSYDKREGSIIYDALAPAAVELAQLYACLDEVLNQVFADTSAREYLVRRAAERGLEPYGAGPATVKGEFDKDVGVGARFSLDSVNFVTEEYIGLSEEGRYIYSLECEILGSEGNITGTLIPIDNISGLSYACVTEILVYGKDEEATEAFRKRYYDSINNIAFGGNIADYKKTVGAMNGVGAVRVYRADDWLGAGTVKIAITAAGGGVPSEELIAEIKEALDPSDYTGGGIGLAPIGHRVSVVGAKGAEIAVGMNLTFSSDTTSGTVYADAESAVKDYIESVNTDWAEDIAETVYISGIIAAVKAVEGVIDVYNVTLNGSVSNLTLTDDSIALCGKITITGEGV